MIDSPNIISGARTVAHMAAHFGELKEVSLKLNKQAAASTRGYFTPSEDEEVRHLLVSYWQSRNALYDLVISLRDGNEITSTDRGATFLVAYAGAILLVDAPAFCTTPSTTIQSSRTSLMSRSQHSAFRMVFMLPYKSR